MDIPLAPQRADELSIEAGRVFSPSAPIDERALFAGRKKEIRQVIDAINQKGRHAIIYGDRGVGKTSLANVLQQFLPKGGGPIFSVRVNCDTGDSFNSLWEKVFSEVQSQQGSVVGGFGGSSQRPRADSTEDVISPEIVRRQLSLWSSQLLPILIIDEFDRIAENYRTIFADTIKTLSDHAVPATVILVGVADSVSQLIAEHQSIQRALEEVKMPRMTSEEIKEVIHKGLSSLGMTIAPDALTRITLLTQGLPHYAHLLGLHATRAALDALSPTITMTTLEAAITRALEGAQQTILNAYQLATISPRKDNLFADVLLSCALAKTDDLGAFAAQDVRWPMQIITGKQYDIPNFAQHLAEFSDEKRGRILKKFGARKRFRYRFTNPLVQPFVIMRGFNEGRVTDEKLRKLMQSEEGWLF